MDLLQGFVSPVLISSIIGYLVYRFNKKKLYTDFITRERMKWLENIRNDFSNLYASINTIYSKDDIWFESCINVYLYLSKMQLYFNPNTTDELEKDIVDNLNKIDKEFRGIANMYKVARKGRGISDQEAANVFFTAEKTIRELFIIHDNLRKILKKEWDNIKKEVKTVTE